MDKVEDIFGVDDDQEDDVFAGLIDGEDQSGSPADKTDEEDKPTQDGDDESKVEDKSDNPDDNNVPFHKHPRWKEREEEWSKKLDEQNATFQKKLDELAKSNQPIEVPDQFKNLYGVDDAKVFSQYQSLVDMQVKSAIAEYDTQKKQEAENQKAEIARYQQQYNEKIDELSKTEKFNKGAFRKWFSDNPVVNIKGDYDFERGLKLYKLETPVKPDKKELIGEMDTNKANKGIGKPKVYTPNTAKGLRWDNI
jgi:hypothetical protein